MWMEGLESGHIIAVGQNMMSSMFLKDYIKYTYAVIAGAQLNYGHFIDN